MIGSTVVSVAVVSDAVVDVAGVVDVVLRVVVVVNLVDRVGLVRVGLVIFDGLGEVVLGVLLGLVGRSRLVVVSCFAKISNK